MKKLGCFLLAVLIVFSLVPFGAFADATYFEAIPNDTKKTATKMELNRLYEGELGSYSKYLSDGAEDEDWYSVDLSAGETYFIYMLCWKESFEGTSVIAEIIDIDGNETYFDAPLTDSDSCYFEYIPEKTGIHYIRLYNYTDTVGKAEHYYAVSVCDMYNEHDYYVDTIQPSSCYEMGFVEYRCKDCGDEYLAIIPAVHKYVSEKVPATFERKGYTRYTCSVCGESHIDDYVAKKTLTKPTISSVKPSSDGLTVKWGKVKNATGYYVYRSKNGGSYTKVKTISSGSTLSYLDTKATGTGTKYSYKVVAYAKENSSIYTSAKSAAKAASISVVLNKTSLELCVGATKTLSAATYPAGGAVKWSSSKSSVAKVSSNGKITAVKKGSATITASYKYNGKTYKATCKVKVVVPSISLNYSSTSVKKGSTTTLKASVTPAGTKVKWSSSDTSVAKVSSSGVITGLKYGTAVITAKITCNGKTYSDYCLVAVKTVYSYSSDVDKTLTFSSKTSITFSIQDKPKDPDDWMDAVSVWFSSSDEYSLGGDILRAYVYSDDGVYKETVTVPAGKYYLSISADYKCSVSLTCKPIPSLSYSDLTLSIGGSKTLKLTGISGECKWSSSNSSVATVDSKGKVVAKSKGTAKITCTLACGKKYTCKVSVKDKVYATVVKINDEDIYNDAWIEIFNNTGKTVTYVELRILQYDNRGYYLSGSSNHRSDTKFKYNDDIPPHSSITASYYVNELAKTGKVKIVKVWFDDGSTWSP